MGADWINPVCAGDEGTTAAGGDEVIGPEGGCEGINPEGGREGINIGSSVEEVRGAEGMRPGGGVERMGADGMRPVGSTAGVTPKSVSDTSRCTFCSVCILGAEGIKANVASGVSVATLLPVAIALKSVRRTTAADVKH